MNTKNYCQSCSMPLDKPELQGTEKNGTKSNDYCIYCYQNGAFINPNMTFDEMKKLVQEQMTKMKLDNNLINKALHILPHLKRWEGESAVF